VEFAFYPNQYRFREKHSTINAVTKFYCETLQSFDEGNDTLAIFLDLSKAFDIIDHYFATQIE